MTSQPAFGAIATDSGTTFRLWAPAARSVALMLERAIPQHAIPMNRMDGWFSIHLPDVKAGARYRYRIDDELLIPDPASRFQPDDVGSPSEVIHHRHDWHTTGWLGRPWDETVFLEIHVGTFTAQGTFRAAIEKLDHIAQAGITAIELMPVSDFPGRWNWGYDGVLPFAPDSAYGRPEDLKALIDAAHARGLMVFLDVVYNHFGPEGNDLGRIAPSFFTDAKTPWGRAIDYRVPEVRAFAIQNALAWLSDYRFDGLRLDAVHAIVSRGEPDILTDLSRAAGALAAQTGRHIHLVLENDDNTASLLSPLQSPPRGRYRAQWNDDFHHAWHVALTGERYGYYKDYTDTPRMIGRILAEGFAYQGEASPYRAGKVRGEPSRDLSPLAFVDFLQNHDQIGNRARGERLTTLAPAQALEIATAILLLSPSPPLLFMGEEWGSTRPFPFFCDFSGDLAQAVRDGRKAEFAEAYSDATADVPDPLAESTMRSAKLDWETIETDKGRKHLRRVTGLLAIRRDRIVPLAAWIVPENSRAHYDGKTLVARWETPERALQIRASFEGTALPGQALADEQEIWGEIRDEDRGAAISVGIGAR